MASTVPLGARYGWDDALLRRILSSRALRYSGLFVLVVLTVLAFRVPVTQNDDAFTSYRYARNLATGHGLVFNPGEYVEGMTNLLWTLLVAAGMKLGLEGEALGHWFSVIFAAGTALVSYGYAAKLLPERARLLALLAPAGMLASNAFLCWTTSGMETPLFVFLCVSACLALLHKRPYSAAVVCFLATLTRPDGAALAACLLGYAALSSLREARSRQAAVQAIGPALLFAVLLAFLEAFRLWYYGDLLPNTFYAKVGGIPVSRGVLYLRNFLVDGPALLIPGACIAAYRLPGFRPALLFAVVMFAYVVAIGGDTWGNGRFLVPVLPMLLGGAIAGGWIVLQRLRASGPILLLALPAFMLWSLYGFWPASWGPPDGDFYWAPHYDVRFPHSAKRAADRVHFIYSPDEDAVVHEQLARIRALNPKPHLLALIGIGKLGYWGQEFRILDMVGLVDRHIARSRKVEAGTTLVPGHSRTDSDYVLDHKPDVIQFACSIPFPVAVDICNNPRLAKDYYLVDQVGFVRRGICVHAGMCG